MAFIVTEGIFIALRVSRLSRLSNRKFSWSWQMLRGGRGGGGGDHVQKIERFYCQNSTFFIQKLIGLFSKLGIQATGSLIKSFSSLVSLYCSHYLPVVTSKLFFFLTIV